MFLGLSTGKKAGMTAAALAALVGLSLLASAFAAPTPTPTPTPTLTPKSGGNSQPNGPGGGGSKPGDGPSGTGKPEATAPPKKDKPGDEDNTPVEVEVDPDLDADLKPKKEKKKEYEKNAVWTIWFKAARASAPNKYAPRFFDDIYFLTFMATKKSGEGMLGSYTGVGFLENNPDTSRVKEQAGGGVLVEFISDWEGPLEGIAFELVGSDAESSLDRLAPLVEESLAPLVPEGKPKPKLSGEAKSSMTWPLTSKQLYAEYADGMSGSWSKTTPPLELTYYIYAYPSGKAEIHLFGTTSANAYHTFWGTISKKVSWKQVR